MYTRCPSCRAEISFEPPVNAASLPDGYKHKIKCPSCGVTIGVKIPRLDSAVQPTFTPQNPNAVSSEPVFQAQAPVAEEASPAKAKKKPYGRAANIFVLLFSALLAVVLGLAYLVSSGSIDVDILAPLAAFDPITPITALIDGSLITITGGDIVATIITLIPSITLVLAVINAIVAIICCAVGTYSRVYNLIWGLLLLAGGVATLLQSGFLLMVAPELVPGFAEIPADEMPTGIQALIMPLMMMFIDVESGELIIGQTWSALLPAGLGVLSFLTALFSLGVRRKKAKAE